MQVLIYPVDLNPVCRFRAPFNKKGDDKPKKSPEEKPFEIESDFEEAILCRQCHQVLTHAAERISIQGSHRHTFANPHGLVFEIGCFQNAPGCGVIGPASDEFTWFPGHRWRVCVCAACLAHLGWLFTAPGGGAFHGLILDRLIEPSP